MLEGKPDEMHGRNHAKVVEEAAAKAVSIIRIGKEFYWSHREGLLLFWDFFMFSVVGFNSFILLLRKSQGHQELSHVICAGASVYLLVLIIQTRLLLKHQRRHKTLLICKKVFRLVYTAIYLTAIMLDVLALTQTEGTERTLVYKGFLFIWVSLWGTNFLWIKQVWRLIGKAIRRG